MRRPTRSPCSLTHLAVAVSTLALLCLTGCDSASGDDAGPRVESVEKGPPIQVNPPTYLIQRNGEGLGDGHGGFFEYTDPVVAGIVMERMASDDRGAKYSVVQRGGSWGVAYEGDGHELMIQPADVRVVQHGISGQALEASLQPGPATFQLAAAGDAGGRLVEWYLNGAPVAQGAQVEIDLPGGYHELSAVIFGDDGSSQSLEIPLTVTAGKISARLEWTIPDRREDGTPLPPEALCCYQVQYVVGSELNYISVTGGSTREVELELEPGFYRFSVVAIDIGGLVSQPSRTVERDLIRPRSA